MEPELRAKLAIYEHFAATGRRPSVEDVAPRVGVGVAQVREIFRRLQARGVSYHANCAWDALGIPAALHQPATVHSRCEQSMEPLEMAVSDRGPDVSDWLFHCVVPAAQWWDDIVFT